MSPVVLADDIGFRCRPADQTISLMTPFFKEMGISRIADQTSLDRLGIPCFASFRPNSATLSTNQGKGLSAIAAKASAVMEAVEFAVAERPRVPVTRVSWSSLTMAGEKVFDPGKFLPQASDVLRREPICWVTGRDLITGGLVWVPLDLVTLNAQAPDFPGICQTTNGLASGNTFEEAVLHGLCELIERDAHTLHAGLEEEAFLATLINPCAFKGTVTGGLVDQIAEAGLELRLFNQTSDIGVPTIMAVLADFQPYDGFFDVAAGYGAHPIAEVAAARAITEAAQTRITSIAGARDDIPPGSHTKRMRADIRALIEAAEADGNDIPDNFPLIGPVSTNEMLAAILARLSALCVSKPVAIELATDLPCSIVRVLCEDLEDAEANLHWRPGRRFRSRFLA